MPYCEIWKVLRAKYLDISNKLMEAQVSKGLEGKEQSQRVSIASPAYLSNRTIQAKSPVNYNAQFCFRFGSGLIVCCPSRGNG